MDAKFIFDLFNLIGLSPETGTLIVTGLFIISELLVKIHLIKANSVWELVVNIVKSIYKAIKPNETV